MWPEMVMCFSCMLSHEYQEVRNRYSQFLFISEDHLCTNLYMQEYDFTMPVPHIPVMSKIDSGEVTMLSQKVLLLATMAKSVIDNCF